MMRLKVANKDEELEVGHILKHKDTGQIVFIRHLIRRLKGLSLVFYTLPDMKDFDGGFGIEYRYDFLNGLEKAGIIALLDMRRKRRK